MAAGRAALVLVGHGSARHPDSAAPIRALADTLRRRGPWAEVTALFMKQDPRIEAGLAGLEAETVVVVPVFAGTGYYTDRLIPGALGLDGPVTRRDGRTILYTPPVGTHPRIPALLAGRAEAVARAGGLDPRAASLLVIAHGSARPGGSAETPRAITAAIAARNSFAEVALAFLEQEPFATGWRDLVRGRELVVLPLLVAQGTHASEDIPPLFGLAPGEAGPIEIDGRRARLAAGLGAEADLADIVAEMARAALAG